LRWWVDRGLVRELLIEHELRWILRIKVKFVVKNSPGSWCVGATSACNRGSEFFLHDPRLPGNETLRMIGVVGHDFP